MLPLITPYPLVVRPSTRKQESASDKNPQDILRAPTPPPLPRKAPLTLSPRHSRNDIGVFSQTG